jgi:hypothetical protein
MRKAIITFGVGYQFEDIRYFLESCKKYCPEADIYMYVGKNYKQLKNECVKFERLHLIQYEESVVPKVIAKVFSFVPGIQRRYATILQKLHLNNSLPKHHLQTIATPLLQFMVKRFFVIEKLMKQLPHDLFMLTDLRDVLLQADPFTEIDQNTIITGIEPIKIHESEMNARWIKNTFNETILNTLKDFQVACAGVTVGSRKAIVQYVNEMNDHVMENLPKIIGMLGPDQGIHIFLFYKGLAGLDTHLQSNGTGSIATLHYSTLDEFEAHAGLLNNKVQRKLAVIHQYDRHPILAAELRTSLIADFKRAS